jgi:hypothetical protein
MLDALNSIAQVSWTSTDVLLLPHGINSTQM